MNIVITGASKGIGRAVAAAFAAEGHRLFLCARNEAHLNATASELTRQYTSAEVLVMKADLSDKASVLDFAAWCLQHGLPDIIVNNAGLFKPGSVHNEPDGLLEEQLSVNLFSAYHLSRALLPAMMKRKSGHIFNLCSIASVAAYANGGAYSISKFAMYGFSKNLREEMKPYGIKVTSVLPGAVMTDSWGDFDNTDQRIMEAEDIAKMIVAAASLSPSACVEEILIRPQLGDL